jgi:hypothetical protein
VLHRTSASLLVLLLLSPALGAKEFPATGSSTTGGDVQTAPGLPAMGPLSAALTPGETSRLRLSVGQDGASVLQSTQTGYNIWHQPAPGPTYTVRLRVMTSIPLAPDRVTGAGLILGAQTDGSAFLAVILAENTLRVARRDTGGLSIPVSSATSNIRTGQWNDLLVQVSGGNSMAISVNGAQMVSMQVPENLATGGAGIYIGGVGIAQFRDYVVQ